MPANSMNRVVEYLRRAALLQDGGGLTDGQLLECFIQRRDEAAFEVLVRRHGPMVLGVCRRVLRDVHEAEDAFQATFLVLLRKAASIRPREKVGNWLYGVAQQTAVRARAQASRRRSKERRGKNMPEPPSARDEVWADMLPVLDEELSRLPEKYRAAIVLCDLEGKTYKQAARQLGCPEGTLSARVVRGRALLARRLTRRGLPSAGAAVGSLLSSQIASAAVPRGLVTALIKAIGPATLGQGAIAGIVSAKVAALTEGVLKTMLLTKLKVGSGIAVVVAMALTSAVLWAFQDQALERRTGAKLVQGAALQKTAGRSSYIVRVPSQYEGVIQFIGTDIKEGEIVPQEKLVTVQVDGKKQTFRRLKKGDAVHEGQLLGRVDDRLARADLALHQAKVQGAKFDYQGASALAAEAKNKYEQARAAYYSRVGRAISEEDYRNAIWTRDKMEADSYSKLSAFKVAELELKKILTVIELHDIRTRVNGVIANIRKHPGEAVKKWETVVEIEVTEK